MSYFIHVRNIDNKALSNLEDSLKKSGFISIDSSSWYKEIHGKDFVICHKEGEVFSKNLDDFELEEFVKLTKYFGKESYIQGEQGEIYFLDDSQALNSYNNNPNQTNLKEKRSFFKWFIFFIYLVVGLGALYRFFFIDGGC